MQNKHTRFKEGFQDLVLFYFPFFVLFFLIPASLYKANHVEFDSESYVVIPFLILSVSILLILFLTILFTKPTNLRARIASIFFYLGIFLCFSDVISAHYLGEVGRGSEELMREPLPVFFIRIFLILNIFLLAKKYPCD